jgi:hypothetical protein
VIAPGVEPSRHLPLLANGRDMAERGGEKTRLPYAQQAPTWHRGVNANSRGGAFCRNWSLSSCDRGQRLISRTQSGREHVVGCLFGQGEGTCLGEGDGGLQRAHDLALHHLHPCIVESALLAKLTGEK